MKLSDDVIAWLLAGWWLFFGVMVAWLGEMLTSKQWQLLMSIPGHKWTWAAAFTISSITIITGLIAYVRPLSVIGLCLQGFGFSAIGGFYAFAPKLDQGLLTLGWFPWIGFAVLSFGVAVARANNTDG